MLETCVQVAPEVAVAAKVAVVIGVVPTHVGVWSVPAIGLIHNSLNPPSKVWSDPELGVVTQMDGKPIRAGGIEPVPKIKSLSF